MNPWTHAGNAARKFGGAASDYHPIEHWFDSLKPHLGDIRHRMILHNAWGVGLAESLFGDLKVSIGGVIYREPFITNSDRVSVFVRDIAQQHVLEDMGRIPSLDEVFKDVAVELVVGRLGVFGPLLRKLNRELADG